MILEKLSNKVNPKRNIYRSPWEAFEKIGSMGVSGEGRMKGQEEKGSGKENLRDQDSGD